MTVRLSALRCLCRVDPSKPRLMNEPEDLEVEVAALRIVLAALMVVHPRPALALSQINGLIADMDVTAEHSPALQAAVPLRQAAVKARKIYN